MKNKFTTKTVMSVFGKGYVVNPKFILQQAIGFILFILPFIVEAQYFEHREGNEMENTFGHGIVEAGDGSFFFLCSRVGDNGTVYSLPQLIKLNQGGEEEWRVELDYEDYTLFKVAFPSDDGGVLLFGSPGDGNDTIWVNSVVKFNEEGEEEWIKEFGVGEDPLNPHGLVQLEDGSYVLLCRWEQSFLLFKLNEEFEEVWIKKYDFGSNFIWPEIIDATFDNGFVVGAGRQGGGPNYMDFFKMDSIGNIEWELTYDEFVESTSVLSEIGHSAIACPDGEFAFSGITYGNSGGPRVLKAGLNGDTVWVGKLLNSGYEGGIVINSHEGGLLVVSGWGYRLYLDHLSLDGTIEWHKEIELDGGYRPTRVHKASNGRYMIVGDFQPEEGSRIHAFAVVTDAEGNITNEFIIDLEKPKVNVFPNPTTDYVNFSLSGSHRNNMELKIFTPDGRTVYQNEFNGSAKISTQKYMGQKGIYFYEISTYGVHRWTGDFLVY